MNSMDIIYNAIKSGFFNDQFRAFTIEEARKVNGYHKTIPFYKETPLISLRELSTYWGILGTSIAVLLSISLATVGFSYQVIKITNCGKLNFLKLVILPFLNTTIMLSILLFIKITIHTIVMSTFLILIIIACISYILISYLFDKSFNYGIHTIIKESLAAL